MKLSKINNQSINQLIHWITDSLTSVTLRISRHRDHMVCYASIYRSIGPQSTWVTTVLLPIDGSVTVLTSCRGWHSAGRFTQTLEEEEYDLSIEWHNWLIQVFEQTFSLASLVLSLFSYCFIFLSSNVSHQFVCSKFSFFIVKY